MSGYRDFSMSNNAIAAYEVGKLPASKAARVFGFKCTRALRQCVRPDEWHHTSKFYNRTEFFDVPQAVYDSEISDLLTWREHMTQTGWRAIKSEIRAKLREQHEDIPFSWQQIRCNRKTRYARFQELARKHAIPFHAQRRIESELTGKELTEENYLKAKKKAEGME